MGMFSWKRKGCGEEVCSPEIVRVMDSEGQVAIGEYDGYGSAGFWDYADSYDEDPIMWHKKCFDEATPEAQADMSPSDYAPDQGFGAPQKRFMSEEENREVYS